MIFEEKKVYIYNLRDMIYDMLCGIMWDRYSVINYYIIIC